MDAAGERPRPAAVRHQQSPTCSGLASDANLRIQYLARNDRNTLICVTAAVDDNSGHRFFIGTGSPLRELPITRFDRHSDGHSTHITTPEGELHVPAPSSEPCPATFNGQPFTLMDICSAQAEHTTEGLVVR